MRTVPTLLSFLIITACGTADTPEPAPPPAEEQPAAPTLTLADLAGTWENTAVLSGVAEPVPSTMSGGADSNWTMSLQGREGIPMNMSIQGDSVIGQSAEYESVLRPGVMVTVRTASVMRDGGLVGNMVASYRTPEGVQEVPGTITGRRVQ
jgi:hypothetical protein